ncbi:MAG: agmatinase [Phycisphaerae bacterium]|nr:agmatinase [Phycisphaerae bacterium]
MVEKLNFCDLTQEYGDSNVVIVPVPYDGTSTWLKGADKGPEALIEASCNMELYDIETDSQVYQRGIFTDEAVAEKFSPEKMAQAVEKRVKSHLDNGKFVALIGGEHSVSVGAIAAHHKHFEKMSVLQFDAHTDLREEYHGSACNHACVMARAKKLCPIVQVGIRSMDIGEKANIAAGQVFFAEKIHDNNDWVGQVVDKLTDNVYITIDLDVFDSAIMPSTGTPEPGGLGWYQVLGMLRAVAEKKNIVGFDVVELCPNKINRGPDFLAAKLVYKVLTYKFQLKV